MRFKKIILSISSLLGLLGSLLLLCMLCLTFADVMLRWLLARPILGATEMIQVFWISLSVAFGITAVKNMHTKVDVFTDMMKSKVRRVVNFITMLLSIIFFLLTGWQVLKGAVYSKQFGIIYWQSNIPEWPVMGLFGISFIVLAFAAILLLGSEWKADAPKNNNENNLLES